MINFNYFLVILYFIDYYINLSTSERDFATKLQDQ